MPAAWADILEIYMQGEAIFWPMLVQAGLTYGIYALVSRRRIAAITAGEAKVGDFRIPANEPERSASANRSLINQYELPVLFYVCCLTLFTLGAAGTAAVLLAWAFAIARLIHAIVHVTSNRVRYRRPAFIGGFLILLAMWGLVVLRLISGA
jgi:hypothetical protein